MSYPLQLASSIICILTEPQQKRLASAVRCAIIMRIKEVSEKKLDKPNAAMPLNQEMICDIQKIARRLAAKASQLIGKLQQFNRIFLFIV